MRKTSHKITNKVGCIQESRPTTLAYFQSATEAAMNSEADMEKGSPDASPAITNNTPKTTPVKKSAVIHQNSVFAFAVQCNNCLKWRKLATEEEFEEFRCTQNEDPFVCEKLSNTSCDNPADIFYDSSRIWAMDKPSIPKTPKGFKRRVMLRRDHTKIDVKYITPHGTLVRTGPEMAYYLQQHPECSHISPSEFCFASPKVMRDTIPEYILNNPTSTSVKKKKQKLSSNCV